jgi:hypothetical protein
LGSTLSALIAVIAKGKVSVQSSKGHPIPDLGSGDLGQSSQSRVVAGGWDANWVSWDETWAVFTKNVKTSELSAREFIYLKYLIPSAIKVVALKSWANDEGSNDSAIPASEDGVYSGFVLTIEHGPDLVAMLGLVKKDLPNPSSLRDRRDSTSLFFANRTDAELARTLLIHAAVVCGAQDNP